MDKISTKDYKNLVDFWNKAFYASEEDLQTEREGLNLKDGWKEFVPSEKILKAVQSLKNCKQVLDYGCGTGWASISLAKAGCDNVTAVDVTENGKLMTDYYANLFGVREAIHSYTIDKNWISAEPSEKYDGLVCSNVLDVIPTEMALSIVEEMARIVKKGSRLVIGLNFYLTPERAKEKGIVLEGGNRKYTDGILRLVNRSDEEWTDIFSQYFKVLSLDHFAWPGEEKETRRLFVLESK